MWMRAFCGCFLVLSCANDPIPSPAGTPQRGSRPGEDLAKDKTPSPSDTEPPSGQGLFTLKKTESPGCLPLQKTWTYVLTFPKSSLKKIKMGVIAGKHIVLKDALKEYNKDKKMIALVNAGFFSDDGPVSFFKAVFPVSKIHGSNSAMGPRGCYLLQGTTFSVAQSTDENYKKFQSFPGNIFCGGPQLVEASKNVVEDQLCKEKFDPKCREDKGGPLAIGSRVPRAASCHTSAGDFIVLVSQPDNHRCGLTMGDLASKMKSLGCLQALNHDGGGSVKLWAKNKEGEVLSVGKENRPVPVWLALYER